MKSKIFFLVLFTLIVNQLFAQSFPHNANSAGSQKAERVASFTVNGANDQGVEINSATVQNNLFMPTLWAYNKGNNNHILGIQATTIRNLDTGNKPLIIFGASVAPTINLNAPNGTQFPWGDGGTQEPLYNRPPFSWINGPNTVMLLSAQNNLGIGVTSPTARLHTNGTVRLQGLPNDTNASFMLGTDTNGNVKEYPVPAGGLDDVDWLTPTGGIPSNINDDMYTNGKVGIGVTNPLETLHLNGNIRGDQTAGALRINTDNGYLDLGAKTTNFTSISTDLPAFRFNKEVQIFGGTLTSTNSFVPAGSNLKLQTVGTTRIFVESTTGNVGINTLSPTAILHTDGDVRFENLPYKNVDYILGTDAAGNVYRMELRNSTMGKLAKIVEKQQMQIEELQKQISLLTSNNKNFQNQLKESRILTLSPNPSTNLVDILMKLSENVKEANIIVSSMTGETLKIIPINDRRSSIKKTINKGGLSAGTYFITLETDGAIVDTKKIIFK